MTLFLKGIMKEGFLMVTSDTLTLTEILSSLGVCWKSLPGGGFLISKSWNFSDPRMMYMYPDCRTCLLGSFQEAELVSANQCELANFVTLVNNSIPVPVLTPVSDSVFSFDPATSASFSRNP